MDELDQKILSLLAANARMPVKEIAEQVSLTSPAVSSRIRKLEESGIIGGYTVVLRRPKGETLIDALISVSAAPSVREELMQLLESRHEVLQCYHVTGAHSFLVKVSCADMAALEHLIMAFQKLGQTSTQIILSTPVDRNGLDIILDQEVV
jgi:Lrp/AsnC family leucine-responsive transcriptional regulator